MLMITSGLKKLTAVFDAATIAAKKPSDQNQPISADRPAGAWTDEAASDNSWARPNEFRDSERLESQTLSMIRGALYAAD